MVEFNVTNQNMKDIRAMMEAMWGFRFLRESDDEKDTQAGEIVATYTDPRGNKWIARCSDSEVNEATKDFANQVLEWISTRGS
jgi:hypothetical protein